MQTYLLISALTLGLGVQLGAIVRRRRDKKRFNGLAGVVSYSSSLVAAYRALETAEPNGLFKDPLAEALAGREVLKSVETSLDTWEEGGAGKRRARKISRIAVRTKWIDDRILELLNRPNPPLQVVLLGSGMDTRPWRMQLPPGTSWFEVDRPDVLDAKRRWLVDQGAALEAGAAGCKYPVDVARWVQLSADLQEANWTCKLEERGWRRGEPTLWLAEGLLMYLEPSDVEQLLREASGASAMGSALVAMAFEDAYLPIMHQDQKEFAGNREMAELKLQFKSTMPADPTEYLAKTGWAVSTYSDVTKMARAMPESQYNFDLGPDSISRFRMFLVAHPSPSN